MPNFLAPHEYARIRISTNDERFIGTMLFSKDFLREDLDLTSLNNLFILKVKENNMEGTFDIDDHVLIKQHPHYLNVKKNIPSEVMAYNFQDGIYAIEENKRIVLRRLQFLKEDGQLKEKYLSGPDRQSLMLCKEMSLVVDTLEKNFKLQMVKL